MSKILERIRKSKKIKKNTKVFSIRVDEDLLCNFKLICKKDEVTIKDAIQHFMRDITNHIE